MFGSVLGPYDLGVAVVVLVVFVVVLAFGRTLRAEWRDMKVTVNGIDKAVNNRPPGEPTLYEQVRAVALKVDDNTASTHAAMRRVGDLAALVTAHIAHHQAEDDAAARHR